MSSVTSAAVFYLSLNDAAKRTQLCVRTLTPIRTGRLRAYRVGRNVRIAERDLQAFVERNAVASSM